MSVRPRSYPGRNTSNPVDRQLWFDGNDVWGDQILTQTITSLTLTGMTVEVRSRNTFQPSYRSISGMVQDAEATKQLPILQGHEPCRQTIMIRW